MKKFDIILADPPWRFEVWSDKGKDRSAEKYYPVMTLEDIKALPVGNLGSDNSVLFLWVISPMLRQGIEVVEAWGYTYKTVGFAWAKTNQGLGFSMGLGYWSRANIELCLLGTKGKPKRVRKDVPQLVVEPRGKHSRKPGEVKKRIVRLLGDLPRIELFAREHTEGWMVWGNEVDSDISMKDYMEGGV